MKWEQQRQRHVLDVFSPVISPAGSAEVSFPALGALLAATPKPPKVGAEGQIHFPHLCRLSREVKAARLKFHAKFLETPIDFPAKCWAALLKD